MSLYNSIVSLLNRKYFYISVLITFVLYLSLIAGCATVDINENSEGPYIVSTYPSPGDFSIPRLTDISIRFSEVMDEGTKAEFQILSSGTRVDGEARWLDSNTTLAFRPYKPLEGNRMYQCIIGSGKSKDGKGLRGAPYIWMFSTGN